MTKLGDICLKIGSGATPSGGKSAYLTEGISLIRSQNVLDLSFTEDGLAFINDEQARKLQNVEILEGDILLNITGDSVARVCIVPNHILPARVNQHVAIIRVDRTKADNNYVLYSLIKSKKILLTLASAGATRNALTKKMIEDFEINLPSISEQRRIASILSALDDKIAVNRRICENLEAQAQALFKHWFIDFAPFKDGKFVESELGMIPEGWRVGTYNDIIQETISGDWGKENEEGNYTHKVACIRGCDFQDVKMGLRGKTPERYILEKNYQTKHFEDKDVLVEISGGTPTVSTGRVCPVSQLLIDKYNGDIVCTNFCRLVRPSNGYSSYLYYSWKYKYDKKVMFGYENGTSGIKNFSIKDFTTREPLILPERSCLNRFEAVIEHIHTQIQNCGSESAKLATIRDTLLPKLMSGQIKL